MFYNNVGQPMNMAAAAAHDWWTNATHIKVPAQHSSASITRNKLNLKLPFWKNCKFDITDKL